MMSGEITPDWLLIDNVFMHRSMDDVSGEHS